MLKLHSSNKKIDTLFLVSLFVLFAITAGILVLLGATQYRATADAMNRNYEVRTTTSYLSEKIRQHDRNTVSVTDLGGCRALTLTQTIDGDAYSTYIYLYDGSLCELFAGAQTDCTPSMGQPIVSLLAFDPEVSDDGLITVKFTDSYGTTHTQYLYFHTDTAKEAS